MKNPQYSYTFAGWDKAITAVTGDATYTAVFTQTIKQYKVAFDASGHGSSPAAITVSVGQKITTQFGINNSNCVYTKTF